MSRMYSLTFPIKQHAEGHGLDERELVLLLSFGP